MFADAARPPRAAPAPAAAQTGAGWMRAVFLCLFVAAAINGALRKEITQGFDEVAHVSYVAHIQKTGEAWPRLESLRLLDPATFRFSDLPSYLNHPAPYYWLLAWVGPAVEERPGAVLALRLINALVAAIGVAALLWLGKAAKLSKLDDYAYCIPIFAIPVLAPIAGSVNNDNLAFAGGAVTLFSAYRLLETRETRWLLAALLATIVASYAKLTGLLLVGGMLAGVFAIMSWRDGLRKDWLALTVIAALAAAAPYAVLWAQYGCPAPETPGQILLLKSTTPEEIGWENAPRLSFAAYAATFAATFVAQWMPTLAERSFLQTALLAAPVVAILCALAGLWLSARRLYAGKETPLDVLVVAGFAAIIATLACHLFFSYRHHLVYAYIADAYPRYYLPLIAIAPLAGLSMLRELRESPVKSAVTTMLIAAPVALALFGAP